MKEDQSELWESESTIALTPRQLKSMLEAAELKGGKLVGDAVSHNLKNQLSMVVGYAELLQTAIRNRHETPASDDELDELAGLIMTDAREAAAIAERFRLINKLDPDPMSSEGMRFINLEASTKNE
jgi:signal transduction histidine kinase